MIWAEPTTSGTLRTPRRPAAAGGTDFDGERNRQVLREDVGEHSDGPVSLGINLATGSTNRLSPPISHQHTDIYLFCQVAAAAAAVQVREDALLTYSRVTGMEKAHPRHFVVTLHVCHELDMKALWDMSVL